MGDSNLRRLPLILREDVQVECYPGAKQCHAIAILGDFQPPAMQVSRVILSFGLYNRSTPIDLSIRQARAMFADAVAAFPFATVSVPLINTSPHLPQEVRDTIMTLKNFLAIHVHIIPLLPACLFSTGPDNIHWSASTAKDILKHWSNYLD